MKFVYEYRTKDNTRHTGVISALDREAAFSALKARGIRPGSVKDAPGFFNKLFGRGKRWLAICVLGVLCLVLCAIVVCRSRTSFTLQTAAVATSLDSPLRRQVIGDAAIIEKGVRTGWADVFSREGDRFLASFAIPGVPAGQRNTTEDELRKVLESEDESVTKEEGIEARQIRAMVAGMKSDIRKLLAKGWSVKDVGAALVRRQEKEISYYEMAKNEIEQAKGRMTQEEIETLWEQRNAKLRGMGVRLVSMPE